MYLSHRESLTDACMLLMLSLLTYVSAPALPLSTHVSFFLVCVSMCLSMPLSRRAFYASVSLSTVDSETELSMPLSRHVYCLLH